MKKILITGGAGFIGTHLSEKFLSGGRSVEVLDNLSTSRISNIRPLMNNRSFKFHKGSVADRTLLRRLVKKCDEVYHLAAAVGVKYILDHPLYSLSTNVKGTENVLEFASKYNKKVLLASTSEVYGKHSCKLFSEEDDRIMGPTSRSRWGYAEAKAVDEFLGLAYHKERGLPVVIVRLFNTVGPLQVGTYGMVLPRLIQQALKNEPMTVYGTGEQLRSFTYVTDVVNALIKLMRSKKSKGQVFNVGSHETVSITDLAKKIKKRTGSKSRIIYVPYKKAYGKHSDDFEDMLCRIPDLSKINKMIGYRPEHDLDSIIDRTVEYFSERRR